MKKDTLNIILAFLTTVFLVYGIPSLNITLFINQIIFLVLIIYVFGSKDDLFWLSWYFIVTDPPGKLFGSGAGTEIFRLPIYVLAPGIALSFSEVFLAMYIVKTHLYRAPYGLMFKKEIWFFVSLALIYLSISFFMGISANNIIYSIRSIMPWFWLLIVPRYITEFADIQRIYHLLAPMVILAFMMLLFTYVTGINPRIWLAGYQSLGPMHFSGESLLRIYSAPYLTFICTVLSVHFLTFKQTQINQNFLILITFIGALSVFLEATRGWFLALIILFASFFFIPGVGLFKQLARILVIVGFLGVILFNLFPIIPAQSSLAFQRILTLGSLLEGDITAEGTLSRLSERGPRVMEAWRESPIIGWGFSNTFHAYKDGHVGHQTNLLNLGILGFIAINMIYLSICFKTLRISRRKDIKTVYGNSFLVFFFSLVGLFIVHSSSGILWGFAYSYHEIPIMFSMIFASINLANQKDTK